MQPILLDLTWPEHYLAVNVMRVLSVGPLWTRGEDALLYCQGNARPMVLGKEDEVYLSGNTLAALGHAIEEGRITEKDILTFLEQPWRVSAAYTNVRQLWTAPPDGVALTADLSRAAWVVVDGDRSCVTTNDGRRFLHDGAITQMEWLHDSSHVIYLVDAEAEDGGLYQDGEHRLVRGRVRQFLAIGEHDMVVVTWDGRIYWDNQIVAGQFEEPPTDLACYGRTFFFSTGGDCYRVDCTNDPPGSWRAVIDNGSGYISDRLGAHVLYRRKDQTLVLDGETWIKSVERTEDFQPYSFLDNGTPYAVTHGEGHQLLWLGAGKPQSYSCRLLPAKIKRVASHAESGQLAIVVWDKIGGEELFLCSLSESLGTVHCTSVRKHRQISQLRAIGPDKFVYIARDGRKSELWFVDQEGTARRRGGVYFDLSSLTTSPSGKRVAAIATHRDKAHGETHQFLVVDGAAGKLHQKISELVFVSNDELRYLAQDDASNDGSCAAYSITLA